MRSRSIELKKIGLLHAHVLILVENLNTTPKEIDKIICPEISNESIPFHEKEMRMMVYGTYRSLNP